MTRYEFLVLCFISFFVRAWQGFSLSVFPISLSLSRKDTIDLLKEIIKGEYNREYICGIHWVVNDKIFIFKNRKHIYTLDNEKSKVTFRDLKEIELRQSLCVSGVKKVRNKSWECGYGCLVYEFDDFIETYVWDEKIKLWCKLI